MSSTGKTATLQLSQFVGTDKPAWLTDYNQDMAKIDAGVKAVDAKVATKDTEIAALQTKDSELASAIAANTNRISTVETTQGTASTDILVLQQNYEQIHHEVAVETEKVTNLSTQVTTLSEQVTTAENNVTSLSDRVTVLENAPEGMHTYSTEEKQVGTWVDGSALYEKSYFAPNVNINNSEVIDNSITIANTILISADFIRRTSANDYTLQQSTNNVTDSTATRASILLGSTGLALDITNVQVTAYSLTIRYVKK